MNDTILRNAAGYGVVTIDLASVPVTATNGITLSGYCPIVMSLGEAITEKPPLLDAGIKVGESGQLDLAYVHVFENTECNNNPLVGLTSSLSQNPFNRNYARNF